MINLWPTQQAIYSALTTAPATYPVHDAVPQGALFPYIVIGVISGPPDEDLAVPSADVSFQMHAWSKTAGKSQVHAMLAFIRGRLDNKPIAGGAWACTEDFNDVMEDPSSTAASRLYHGVARYRVRAN